MPRETEDQNYYIHIWSRRKKTLLRASIYSNFRWKSLYKNDGGDERAKCGNHRIIGDPID